jgi:hypothetical protein
LSREHLQANASIGWDTQIIAIGDDRQQAL